MIKIIGLRKPVYDFITDTYNDVLTNVDGGSIVEFCKSSFLRTYANHVEIEVCNEYGTRSVITISIVDFYRIEIE